MLPQDQQKNYELFRDCLSEVFIEKVTRSEGKSRRRRAKSTKNPGPAIESQEDVQSSDPEELADFIEYIASETFESIPTELKTLDYYAYIKDSEIQDRYALPLTGSDVATLIPSIDPSVCESLTTYGITNENEQGINEFLAPVLTSLVTLLATPPPAPISTKNKATECEICGRDWINLTYHHLIPRFVHDKVVKRGWHREEDLQNVAWLCGACHRFVHQFAGHEDLARHYYTVDLLLEQEEIVQFAKWVGRLRWKGR